MTFNGGGNKGLVKIEELTQKLNQLVQQFNTHTHAVTGATDSTPPIAVSGTTAITTPAPSFNKSQYEDTKVKH